MGPGETTDLGPQEPQGDEVGRGQSPFAYGCFTVSTLQNT